MADLVASDQLIEGLVEIFASVLPGVEIDADSDLFDLGGHSIVAGQVVARAREILDIPVSLRDVFTARTPRGIVEAVDRRAPLPRR
ncbi:phosphopantetheine-binding protein [Lentzea sp. JNUCC 0626]|uniref:phosphopantetheine-binding protein n=1 Tax=Lentzea sp. JNUCC 0626 TaxID=3367513 RepID=UPI00374A2E8D